MRNEVSSNETLITQSPENWFLRLRLRKWFRVWMQRGKFIRLLTFVNPPHQISILLWNSGLILLFLQVLNGIFDRGKGEVLLTTILKEFLCLLAVQLTDQRAIPVLLWSVPNLNISWRLLKCRCSSPTPTKSVVPGRQESFESMVQKASTVAWVIFSSRKVLNCREN